MYCTHFLHHSPCTQDRTHLECSSQNTAWFHCCPCTEIHHSTGSLKHSSTAYPNQNLSTSTQYHVLPICTKESKKITFFQAQMCVYVSLSVCISVCGCVCARTHVCACVCVHACMFAYVCVCMYCTCRLT